MKRTLLTGIVFSMILGGITAQEKNITFEKKNYILDKAYEFEDEAEFKKQWYSSDCSEDFRGRKVEGYPATRISKKENVVWKQNSPETVYVKDGSLHLIEQHYEEDGITYYLNGGVFSHIEHGTWIKPEEPYGFNQGLVEIRFKFPKDQGVTFDIFPSDLEDGWSDFGEGGIYNDQGYNFTELDFCEFQVGAKGYAEPHGGVHIANKNHKKVYGGAQWYSEKTGEFLKDNPNWQKNLKIKDDSWYDQWHTMQVLWEDYKITLYYDGKLYKTEKWDKKYGNPVGEYGFQICVHQGIEFLGEVDWNDTKKHDFQIDYIRVYKEIGSEEKAAKNKAVYKKWTDTYKDSGEYIIYNGQADKSFRITNLGYSDLSVKEGKTNKIAFSKYAWALVSFEFKKTEDLSALVSEGYCLEFFARNSNTNLNTVIEFTSYDKAKEPWARTKTLTTKDILADGNWHKVRIPLSDFVLNNSRALNGRDNKGYTDASKFNWKEISKIWFCNTDQTYEQPLEFMDIKITK